MSQVIEQQGPVGMEDARLAVVRPSGPLALVDDAVLDVIVATIKEKIAAYREYPPESLRPVILESLRCGLAAIVEHRAPTPDELDAFAEAAARQAERGVPADAMLQASLLAMRRTLDLVRDRLEIAGYEPPEQVGCADALLAWTMQAVSRVGSSCREAQKVAATADQQQRIRFLRRLLFEGLDEEELWAKAATYGLARGLQYVPFRAVPAAGVGVRELVGEILQSPRRPSDKTFIGVVGGELVGVVTWMPKLESGGVVGIGPATDLTATASSFRLASRALETAQAFGLEGVVSMEGLSLRPAVLSEDVLGEALLRGYVTPLDELGEFGRTVEATVRAYLAANCNIEDAAKQLGVHPNTVRHRLERYEATTGTDLRRTRDVVEAWWAFERRLLDRPLALAEAA